MARYHYSAEDESGQRMQGELEAADRDEALRLLRQQGMRRPQLTEEKEPHGRLSSVETDQLTQVVADLAESGAPMAIGFRAAAEEMGFCRLSSVLKTLANHLDRGVSLDQAIDELTAVVPEHVAGLIMAGVRTNNVSQVLTDITDMRIRIRENWNLSLASLAYPTFALLFGAVLFSLFSIFVVATFRELYLEFAIDLPVPTRILIWCNETGGWMLASFLLTAPIVAAFTPMIFGMSRYRRMLAATPVVGPIFHWNSVTEMLRLLGLMVDNSIPLPEALRLTSSGVRDASIREMCREMAEEAERGESLWQIVAQGRLLPMTIVPLIRWGEQTQRLPEALRQSAEMLENRVRMRSKLLRVTYPPIVFVVIFVGLVFAIVSMYLPLTALIGGLI